MPSPQFLTSGPLATAAERLRLATGHFPGRLPRMGAAVRWATCGGECLGRHVEKVTAEALAGTYRRGCFQLQGGKHRIRTVTSIARPAGVLGQHSVSSHTACCLGRGEGGGYSTSSVFFGGLSAYSRWHTLRLRRRPQGRPVDRWPPGRMQALVGVGSCPANADVTLVAWCLGSVLGPPQALSGIWWRRACNASSRCSCNGVLIDWPRGYVLEAQTLGPGLCSNLSSSRSNKVRA